MQGRDHYAAKAETGSEESASRMAAAETAAPAAGDWKLEDLRVRPAENGGVIVTCSKRRDIKGKANENASYEDRYRSKDYAFTTPADALTFIQQELSGADGSAQMSGMAQSAPIPG